ncbi:MAG TPA: sigma-70 family RNA polymerase sigma factor [Opitutaceae bacterium]|nr:sigma-70 family RNA polymerase sigma factor [Opitutaceae bacterium]
MQTLADDQLVLRVNRGDECAFREIVSRHAGKLSGLAWCIVRNSSDAEEIVQDAFVRAHRGLAGFRGDCALSTWLYRITTRLAFRRRRTVQRRRRHEVDPEKEPADGHNRLRPENSPDPALGPVGEVELAELKAAIDRSIRRLAPGHRQILYLRNRRRRSYQAISGQLGIGVGTVKSRLFRAREVLRRDVLDIYPGLYGPG